MSARLPKGINATVDGSRLVFMKANAFNPFYAKQHELGSENKFKKTLYKSVPL